MIVVAVDVDVDDKESFTQKVWGMRKVQRFSIIKYAQQLPRDGSISRQCEEAE